MPISSKDFEKNERESSLMLMDFLRAHPLEAYSADELAEMMMSQGRKLGKDEVERMLMLMEYGRKITSRKVGGVTYYRYREFLGNTPPPGPI